ncbi:membrane protein [Mycolicibacterium insubricum]|uniref:Uncharacterized protein n=1 Tax=Mycolicibacterium insubricum TaxID=444597 RepID=A0A1X0CYV8_9MYCO|nr:MMPL family transporter [Mycolicibacterium insubricum]ORA65361.1 hypothetical protein BST26_18765 [Mycolicibacterium insubricum]BBZ65500.1 membrane protein [Mycolicibacterium insubricum]
MLDAVAHWALAGPKRVLLIAGLLMALCGALGAPAATMLSSGGYTDPNAESNVSARTLVESFGQGAVPLYLLVRSDSALTGPSGKAAVAQLVTTLGENPDVAQVRSPWDLPDPVAAGALSRDGHAALVTAAVGRDEDSGLARSAELLAKLATLPLPEGITVSAGGPGPIAEQINEQSRRDLAVSEAIALPLTFLALIWVFGGVVAALIPLAVGGFAVMGTMAVLRGLAEITDVSIFALNLATALGFALAIDYSLLLVNRYREEVADGTERGLAIRRMLHTAGRTVVFSAVTVALSLATMAVFPMYLLRSFAYGGVPVVLLAAVASLILVPAAILVTGDRVGMSKPRPPITETRWYRWSQLVMRRPVLAAVAALVPLLIAGLPFAHVKFGFPDDRILPASAPARQVGDAMRTDFTQDAGSAVNVVITGVAQDNPALYAYARALSDVDGVLAVSTPSATILSGHPAAPPSGAAGVSQDSADAVFFTVATAEEPYSPGSGALLDRLHQVPAPAAADVAFGGAEQANRDGVTAIATRLPVLLMLIAVVMMTLLFLLTGSVVIPIKALVLNVLSLSATFGAMVWIFQDGHLGGLGTTEMGTLVASLPVLMFCIAFGLSMDYEVFLISRIREFWQDSDGTAAANTRAVALGLATTGRIVTAAALIMIIVFAGLAASQVAFMRMFGVGLIIAIVVDVTLIRMVLLPAAMALMGRWNWWAPAPLARLHTRLTGVAGPADRYRSRTC